MSPYSSSPVFYAPKSRGYYTVCVNVKDSNNAIVRTVFLPDGDIFNESSYIDVE